MKKSEMNLHMHLNGAKDMRQYEGMCETAKKKDKKMKKIKLIQGNHYHLEGGFYYGDEIVDFVQEIVLTRIEKTYTTKGIERTYWAMYKEGDEFEVQVEDLNEIKK